MAVMALGENVVDFDIAPAVKVASDFQILQNTINNMENISLNQSSRLTQQQQQLQQSRATSNQSLISDMNESVKVTAFILIIN